MSNYIDRQAAIEAIKRLILPQTKGETMAEEINRVAWRCAINCAEEIIGHLPTIEAEPVKRGKWIKISDRNYKCSVCGDWWSGEEKEIKTFIYCPNCGAKMEEEEA